MLGDPDSETNHKPVRVGRQCARIPASSLRLLWGFFSLHQVRSCLRTLVLKAGALSRKAWFCVLEQTTSVGEPRAGVGRETLNQRPHYAQ